MIELTDKEPFATYETIGKRCYAWFIAERERVNARIQRAKARDSHKCKGVENGGEPCYYNRNFDALKFDDWCDNCKYVQPFHLSYIQAARKSAKTRYQLTRRLKNILVNEDV